MSAPDPRLLSADEFFDAYGSEKNVDLVRGKVVRYSMSNAINGFIKAKIAFYLSDYVDIRNLGRCFLGHTHLQLQSDPDTVRGVDFCFLSYSQLSEEAELDDSFMTLVPELVVEIRLTQDSWPEVMVKVHDYLQAGVNVVLVLDPATKTVKRYRADGEQETFPTDGVLKLPELFPEFECSVAKLFQ